MSKKEKNAWDRFWLYVKENEKVIWVLLLLLLAPTFAFTGAFQSYMTRGKNPKYASLFGQSVHLHEFNLMRTSLMMVQDVRTMAYAFDPYRMMMRYQPSTSNQGVLEFLVEREEASRLGLRVTDYEVGSAIREIYRNLVAQEAARKEALAVKVDNQKDAASRQQSILRQTYMSTLEDLEKKDEFGAKEQADWFHRLQNWSSPTWRSGSIPRGEFEDGLRDILLVEKLQEYVKGTVQVTQDEAFAQFQKDEQSRKFSFFTVSAEAEKGDIEKALTDADLAARFEKKKEDFRQPLALKVEYLAVPVAAFEKDVTLTDDDLRKEYDRVKSLKYQTFVGDTPGGFALETPEQKAEREAKAFKPFDQVKEEVRADLLKIRTREAARSAAEKIRERLFPQAPGSVGEKKEEKPAPVPATYEEIVKDFPVVKVGSTPWAARDDAEKEMGEAWSSTVSSWFVQLTGDRNRPAKTDVDPPKSYIPTPSFSDPQMFVFYKKPGIRPAGLPKDLAEVKDKVRETLLKERLFEKAKEKAKVLAEALKDGKKSFEDAAKETGSSVITTGFITKNGTVKVPMTAEEIAKAAAEKKDPDPAAETPKEKDFPGSTPIVEFGFRTVQEKGKVEGFAEDPVNGSCYLVRWDDVIFPDAEKFAADRSMVERRLLMDKQNAYLTEWKKQLGLRSQAGFFFAQKEEGEES